MNNLPFIDFHTHKPPPPGVTAVVSLFPSDPVPARTYFSAGIHPWYVQTQAEEWDRLVEKISHPLCLAVGECGMDRMPRFRQTLALQEEIFKRQIDLSAETGKPLVIHCVRCYDRLLRLLPSSGPPKIIHGFTKGPELAERLTERDDIYLSFGPALLREKSKAAESFRILPPERILLETDASEIPVRRIYEAAASLRGTTVENIKRIMAENFSRIFKKSVFSPKS
ncbi:MAG: TatD family hydrolase [Chlorobi bacterium]|nr:TatD family hydrolase [Chlorobiota bacterium]